MVPETQADHRPIPQKRQVRTMDQEVEHPVREHRQADEHAGAPGQLQQRHQPRPDRDRPQHRRRQAVGIGHVTQHQGAARQAGIDARPFDAGQDQPAPGDVDGLAAQDIGPQWDARFGRPGGQGRRVVSNEHAPRPRTAWRSPGDHDPPGLSQKSSQFVDLERAPSVLARRAADFREGRGRRPRPFGARHAPLPGKVLLRLNLKLRDTSAKAGVYPRAVSL